MDEQSHFAKLYWQEALAARMELSACKMIATDCPAASEAAILRAYAQWPVEFNRDPKLI
jgi:hypothetical protein